MTHPLFVQYRVVRSRLQASVAAVCPKCNKITQYPRLFVGEDSRAGPTVQRHPRPTKVVCTAGKDAMACRHAFRILV